MFKRAVTAITLVLIILLESQGVIVFGWEIDQTTQVTSVIDGDTFRIPNDRVRLADINAPENGTEPGYSKAKNVLANIIGGKTVYLDTDQKTGRDPFGRLVAVVYVRYNSTHYLNVNEALLLQGVVVETNFTNNEFEPSSWTLYLRYSDPSQPAITSNPSGSLILYVYAGIGIGVIAVIVALIALNRRK